MTSPVLPSLTQSVVDMIAKHHAAGERTTRAIIEAYRRHLVAAHGFRIDALDTIQTQLREITPQPEDRS